MKKTTATYGFFLFATLFIAMMFAGCSANWTTDYDAAFANAAGGTKDILVYFDASAWDAPAKEFDEKVISTDEFKKLISDEFVLVKVQMPLSAVDATPEDEKVIELVQKYQIQFVPVVYLHLPNGEPYAVVPCTPPNTIAELEGKTEEEQREVWAKEFYDLIHSYDEEKAKTKSMIDEIQLATGLDRVKMIDAYIATRDAYLYPFTSTYMDEVLALTKDATEEEAKTLRYDYTLRKADLQAGSFFQAFKLDESLAVLEELLATTELKPEDTFYVYYQMAYLNAFKNTPIAEIESYVNKAIEADPQNPNVTYIKEFLAQVQYSYKQAEMLEQLQAEENAETSAEEAK